MPAFPGDYQLGFSMIKHVASSVIGFYPPALEHNQEQEQSPVMSEVYGMSSEMATLLLCLHKAFLHGFTLPVFLPLLKRTLILLEAKLHHRILVAYP